MINGAQAIVNLIVALPAGHYLARKAVDRTVFLSAILQRLFYGVLVLIPVLFMPSEQMVTILAITFIMSIPGTSLAIGQNALFADSIPVENRGRVAGIRNAVLSISTIVSTLVCGQVLMAVVFPVNYQIVFGIGFLGALMSTLHLKFVKPVFPETGVAENVLGGNGRRRAIKDVLRIDVLRGRYGTKIGLLLFFHIVQYLGIAIFAIYQVNEIHLSDSVLSIGNGLFYVLMFVVSVRLEGFTRRFGYKKALGLGICLLSSYPALLAMSTGPHLYYVASCFGGIGWGFVGGTLYNYILEASPPGGRAGYLAWYNLVFNAGILVGSLGGPYLGHITNLHIALWIIAAGRLAAGAALFLWG